MNITMELLNKYKEDLLGLTFERYLIDEDIDEESELLGERYTICIFYEIDGEICFLITVSSGCCNASDYEVEVSLEGLYDQTRIDLEKYLEILVEIDEEPLLETVNEFFLALDKMEELTHELIQIEEQLHELYCTLTREQKLKIEKELIEGIVNALDVDKKDAKKFAQRIINKNSLNANQWMSDLDFEKKGE